MRCLIKQFFGDYENFTSGSKPHLKRNLQFSDVLLFHHGLGSRFWTADFLIMFTIFITLTLIGARMNDYHNMVVTVASIRVFHAAALTERFMGPTWGPYGADRTQVGPMLALWTLLSGRLLHNFESSSNSIMTCFTLYMWYIMRSSSQVLNIISSSLLCNLRILLGHIARDFIWQLDLVYGSTV